MASLKLVVYLAGISSILAGIVIYFGASLPFILIGLGVYLVCLVGIDSVVLGLRAGIFGSVEKVQVDNAISDT